MPSFSSQRVVGDADILTPYGTFRGQLTRIVARGTVLEVAFVQQAPWFSLDYIFIWGGFCLCGLMEIMVEVKAPPIQATPLLCWS